MIGPSLCIAETLHSDIANFFLHKGEHAFLSFDKAFKSGARADLVFDVDGKVTGPSVSTYAKANGCAPHLQWTNQGNSGGLKNSLLMPEGCRRDARGMFRPSEKLRRGGGVMHV